MSEGAGEASPTFTHGTGGLVGATAKVTMALTWPLPSSCNLTCPPGRYGANCAESCGCHDGACDPLTGACHMGECWAQAGARGSAAGVTRLSGRFCLTEANQRMGVIGAGALLALLLILLLSLLCCCCVCRKKDEARG